MTITIPTSAQTCFNGAFELEGTAFILGKIAGNGLSLTVALKTIQLSIVINSPSLPLKTSLAQSWSAMNIGSYYRAGNGAASFWLQSPSVLTNGAR